jgi:hypothetical protein
MPVSQYRVRDEHGDVIFRADFAFVEDRLLMPVDGYDIHSDREAPTGAERTTGNATRRSPKDGASSSSRMTTSAPDPKNSWPRCDKRGATRAVGRTDGRASKTKLDN